MVTSKRSQHKTEQEIAVDDKGGHFQAIFPDIFADSQNPPLVGDVRMGNKAWYIYLHHSPGGNFSLIGHSGVPRQDVVCHLWTI